MEIVEQNITNWFSTYRGHNVDAEGKTSPEVACILNDSDKGPQELWIGPIRYKLEEIETKPS